MKISQKDILHFHLISRSSVHPSFLKLDTYIEILLLFIQAQVHTSGKIGNLPTELLQN